MGYKIAAKHLRRYLDGTGGTEHPKRRWLRSYKKIRDAEARIRENFQEKTIISKIGKHIAKDNQFTFTDWFDGNIRYMIGEFSHEELFLATGDSSIRATGNFAATIKGERVIVTGKVRYKWYDDYNFHKGLGIWVPGEGHIPDAAMRKLKTHGNAKDFHMQRIWHQTLKADFLLGDAPYAIDWRWGEAF
jgi:hypothetical protein